MPDEIEYQFLQAQKPRLRILQDAALNAEARPECLDEPITPTSAFFIRNNGQLPSPQTDEVQWSLTVDGEIDRPTTWTLADLKARFEQVSVTAVLECAGNGRAFFSPPPDGLPWRLGAVGCARWTGVRLRDLLIPTGVKDSAVYTGHISPDIAADGSGKLALSR